LQASSIGAGIEGWPIHRRPEDVWRDRIVFDLAWSEMAIILVVALVVVGPKDLPRLARTLGQWIAKGRSMAREFQRHIDDMAREADLADLKDSDQKISPSGIRREITKAVDPDGTLSKSFDTSDINRSLESQPSPPPPPSAPATAVAPPAGVAEVMQPDPAPVPTAAVPAAAEPAPKSTPAPAEKA
jgi:sec-independent protein translocase protein TatB